MGKTLEEIRKELEEGVYAREPSKDKPHTPGIDLKKMRRNRPKGVRADHIVVDDVIDDDGVPIPTKKRKRHGRFTISADGTDAVLHFGKHKDRSISELVKEDSGYLAWILAPEQEFEPELIEVVRHQIGATGTRKKRKKKMPKKRR